MGRPGADRQVQILADALTTSPSDDMAERAGGFYRDAEAPVRHGDLGALRSYERWTRVDGIVSIVLMLLALAGIVLARGRQRAVGILLGVLAFGGMLGSALTQFYDARYAIVTWGPLAAAAGIGAAAVTARIRGPRAQDREAVG